MKIVGVVSTLARVEALAVESKAGSAGALLEAAGARNATQMASLLQSLAKDSLEGDGVEQLDETIQQALYVIKGNLVDAIRNTMINEHRVDQEDIMDQLDCFEKCNIDKKAAEEECKTYTEEAAELNTQHASCRSDLMTKYVTKIEECNALDDWVASFKLTPKIKEFCVYDPAYLCHLNECPDSAPCKPSIDEKFGNWLQGIIQTANSGLNTWKNLHQQCKASYHAYIKKDAECDVKQSNFELKVCGGRTCRNRACNDEYASCRARCENSYHLTNKRVECAEKDRKIDWSATEKIECFLRILLASPTDEDVQTHCKDKTKCLSEWRTNEYDKCTNVCEEVDYDSGSYSQHARRGGADGKGLDYDTFWHESQQPLRQHADMEVDGDSTWGVNTTHRVGDKTSTDLEKRCTQHLDIDFQPIPECEPCKEEAPMPCDEVFKAKYYQQFNKKKQIESLKEQRKCHTEDPGEHTEKWAHNLCDCRQCGESPPDFCPRPSTCPPIIRDQDYLGGKDYKQVILSSAENCQQLCSHEEGCKSFAFTAHNGKCYLKNAIPDLRSNTMVDSGLPCSPYNEPAGHVVKKNALCTGSTPPGATAWQKYSNGYIMVDVDTSVCGFTETPHYITSLQGTTRHWTSTGSSEVYKATATGFRIYINMKVSTAEANNRKYAVNWVAASPENAVDGACMGAAQGWKKYSTNGIYQDVNTQNCAFSERPVYMTSLTGDSSHWTTTGSSEIYYAKANSFRQYLSGTTTEKAAQWNYNTHFLAFDPSKSFPGACAGRLSSSDWKVYSKDGLMVDVDTSKCGFTATPVYVSSLHGSSSHWTSKGSSEIYKATAKGFRVYVYKKGITLAQAKQWNWHLEWLAAEQTEAEQ